MHPPFHIVNSSVFSILFVHASGSFSNSRSTDRVAPPPPRKMIGTKSTKRGAPSCVRKVRVSILPTVRLDGEREREKQPVLFLERERQTELSRILPSTVEP